MHDMALESGAYRLAELKSERLRTGALIGLGVVFVAVVLLRDVMFGSEESRASLPSLLLLLAAFMLFETWMLWRVAGALATESSLPNGTRSLKVVVEALVPTAVIVLATMGPYLGPYRALTGPAIAVYYLFIILATLRLDPRDATIAGVVSAAGYAAVVVATYQWYPDHPARAAADATVFGTHAIMLLLAGWIAG